MKIKDAIAFLRGNRIVKFSALVVVSGITVLVVLSIFIHILAGALRGMHEADMRPDDVEVHEANTRLQDQLDDIEDDWEVVREGLIHPDNILGFVRDIESSAAMMGVGLSLETATDTAQDAEYRVPVVRYRLTISGSFGTTARYFSLLHSLRPMVRIERVSIIHRDVEDLAAGIIAEVMIVAAMQEENE